VRDFYAPSADAPLYELPAFTQYAAATPVTAPEPTPRPQPFIPSPEPAAAAAPARVSSRFSQPASPIFTIRMSTIRAWVAAAMGVPVLVIIAFLLYPRRSAPRATHTADVKPIHIAPPPPLAESGVGLFDHNHFQKALPLLTAACDGADMPSCNDLGSIYAHARNVPLDFEKANTFFEKACDHGSSDACNNLGALLHAGSGVTRDDARAKSLFAQTCINRSAIGCLNLGLLGGDPQAFAKALDVFQKECTFGHLVSSCTNLGLMYDNASGVPQDYGRAKALFEQACNLSDADACSNLGLLYQEAHGVPQDYAQAIKFFQKSCDLGGADGCADLGNAYWRGYGAEHNNAQAVYWNTRSCDAGSGAGCTNLGSLYRVGNGVDIDLKKARELMQKGCALGNVSGCARLKEMG
jgi:TPR repeat protein